MKRLVVILAAASLLTLCAVMLVAQDKRSGYQRTRDLLARMEPEAADGTLGDLFNHGDERVADLIQALDDKDNEVSLNAQRVIRYLGNPVGMKALFAWYERRAKETGSWVFTGSVPLPMTDWDFAFIKSSKGLHPEFAYALVLDESSRAQEMRDEAFHKPSGLADSCTGIRFEGVKKYKPGSSFPNLSDIAKQVLDHAFFICPPDMQYTRAKLMAFNGTKDKALIYIKIDRGPLAEEWYHVVIERTKDGWRFFSITQVAVS